MDKISKTAEECRSGDNFFPFTRLCGTKYDWLGLKEQLKIGESEGYESVVGEMMVRKIEEMFPEE